METVTYDLAVCGGGPAGSAAAITASRLGARVLLLERGRFPRHKVCGEFVSAESLGLLASLLARTAGESLLRDAMRITRVRFFADGASGEAEVQPPAASIRRYDLDYALWEAAAQAGAECRQQVNVEGVERLAETNFRLATSAGEFRARGVIDASGRWSKLNRSRVPEFKEKHWIGLKAHFTAEEGAPAASVDLFFFAAGYCGVQRVGSGLINVAAMVRSDRLNVTRDLMRQVLALEPRLEERSRGWQQASRTVTTSPLLFLKPVAEAGGILRVGDAAGFVDPFVGDGISLALQTGAAAAESLVTAWSEHASLQKASVIYTKLHQKRTARVFAAAGRVRRLFWLPGIMRRQIVTLLNSPSLGKFMVQKTRAGLK